MNTDIDANDGTWHHVLVTWSSNRGAWKMYKNALLWDQGYNLAAGETIKGDLRLNKGFENICLVGSFFKYRKVMYVRMRVVVSKYFYRFFVYCVYVIHNICLSFCHVIDLH